MYKPKRIQKKDYRYLKFHLFTRQFFEESLNSIHEQYRNHYQKKNSWKAKTKEFEQNFFDREFTFVEKFSIHKDSKTAVIGDIHSGFHSLLQFIFDLNLKGFFEEGTLILKKNSHIIFLGDLVDRGPYSLEILFLVFHLKQLNFDQVHINNGNHKDFPTYSRCSFTNEIEYQFGIKMEDGKDYPFLNNLLKFLPSALYMTFNQKTYHLSHGVVNPFYAGADENGFFGNKDSRLKEFLDSDHLFDFVNFEKSDNYRWSDCCQINHDHARMLSPTRGSEKLFTFDYKFINDYLEFHGLTAIIRGHQDHTNLGLIRADFSEEEKTVIVDYDKKFELDGGKYPRIFWEPTDVLRSIKLTESKDFTVITTSSAAIVRKINTAYLILQRQPNERNHEESCHNSREYRMD